MTKFECDKCGESDCSKLVKYEMQFSKPVIFCGKCALELIPLNRNAVKHQRSLRHKYSFPNTSTQADEWLSHRNRFKNKRRDLSPYDDRV